MSITDIHNVPKLETIDTSVADQWTSIMYSIHTVDYCLGLRRMRAEDVAQW